MKKLKLLSLFISMALFWVFFAGCYWHHPHRRVPRRPHPPVVVKPPPVVVHPPPVVIRP